MTNEERVEQYKLVHKIDGELLTFDLWKERGYQVKRNCIPHRVKLWKEVQYTYKNDDGKECEGKRYFLKNFKLFSENQVYKIQ